MRPGHHTIPGKPGRILLTLLLLALTGCSGASASSASGSGPAGEGVGLDVVATTPIIADFARRVGGDRARVHQLVPSGADPHSYEPGLRDIRDIAYADLALTNGMLLEQQKLTSTVTANLKEGAVQVPVAEKLESHGGILRPMTEDLSLDTVWLGLRAQGGRGGGTVRFSTDRISGPGHAAAFITQTFGTVQKVADSESEGAETRQEDGTTVHTGDLGGTELPEQAHTHLSWGFTEAGTYAVRIGAEGAGRSIPAADVHFAVGTDPYEEARKLGPDAVVLDAGHADVTADLDHGRMVLRADTSHGPVDHDPARTVLSVPAKALQELPAGSQYRFLGRPGDLGYLLAQAVLGEHVHGEIDPHFWHSVPNAEAAVKTVQEEMTRKDPAGATVYAASAHAYLQELDGLEADLKKTYGELPPARRNLVTTHDGYGYLAEHYGLSVAGFVAPVPGTEPSLQQRRRLDRAIEDLHIPAVFVDVGDRSRTTVLQQVADEAGVRLCRLYSDTLDADAPQYTAMMRRNAQEITACLRP